MIDTTANVPVETRMIDNELSVFEVTLDYPWNYDVTSRR